MKKIMLFFVLLGLCFAWSCRPKEIEPSLGVNEDNALLKSVSVKGATDVKIDNDLGIIQVTLPESYSSKSINLDFTLKEKVRLGFYDRNVVNKTNSTYYITEKGILEFSFQGAAPLNVSLVLPDISAKDYKIYVKQINKKLRTEISRIDSVWYNLYFGLYLKPISFNGTYPSTPTENLPLILLRKVGSIDTDTVSFSKSIESNADFIGQPNLRKYYPFDNQLFTLEFVSNGEKQILSENLKFSLSKPTSKFFSEHSSIHYISEKSKNIELTGGVFSNLNRYTLKFHNDFSDKNYQLDAQVKDLNYLITNPPSQIPAGGYLVDIFENDKLINQEVTNIGVNKSASAIRSIVKKWDSNSEGLADYTTKKEQLMAGDSLLILPVNYNMICCASSYVDILAKFNSPKLRLKSNSKEIDLIAIAKSFGWAIAGGSVVYFQYTIPKSTEPGFYEAQLVYPDGRESLKYWNKIEIK